MLDHSEKKSFEKIICFRTKKTQRANRPVDRQLDWSDRCCFTCPLWRHKKPQRERFNVNIENIRGKANTHKSFCCDVTVSVRLEHVEKQNDAKIELPWKFSDNLILRADNCLRHASFIQKGGYLLSAYQAITAVLKQQLEFDVHFFFHSRNFRVK